MCLRPLPLMGPFAVVAFALALFYGGPAAARDGAYSTQGDCSGLPAVRLRVAEGFCVGLAAQRLGSPRGVLPLPDGRILVTDMGRWDAKTGRLLVLTRGSSGYQVESLLSGLDRPHGLQLGPDGLVYVGEAGRVVRVDMGRRPLVAETIIDGLPTHGRHPIKNFVFGPDGALYLNRGAPSDHCEESRKASTSQGVPCAESEGDKAEAAIWRYQLAGGVWTGKVFARGLRNSTALVFDRSGNLWQGENSRDVLPDGTDSDTLPHDEVNLVRAGRHYGWPYCYDHGVVDQGFGLLNCDRYTKPFRLLPAHSAPLGMAFYEASAAPTAWRRMLLVALHGYRANGHRIIGYPLDDAGRPGRKISVLVDGWAAKRGRNPMGAPTDIRSDSEGRLWVTEDRNGTLLVVTPSGPEAGRPRVNER